MDREEDVELSSGRERQGERQRDRERETETGILRHTQRSIGTVGGRGRDRRQRQMEVKTKWAKTE